MNSEALAALPRIGALAVLDLARCPSHEARLAFSTLMSDVSKRVGGRVAWSGSIDQQLIGHGLESLQEVVITEYPTGEACLRALGMRREWQPESFVNEWLCWAARPWSRGQQIASRIGMGLMRLRGGAPPPLAGALPSVLTESPPNPLDPDAQQLAALARADRERPVVMLNFLRYRALADGLSPTEERPGSQAYAAYGRVAAGLIARMGGRIRYLTRPTRILAGDPEAAWDALVAVQYPSRGAFLGMLADPRYRAATPHRHAGLDSTRLFACTPHAAFF